MFKYLSVREQIIEARAEIARLRATVGELPPVEVAEGEEIPEQPKLVDRLDTVETDVVEVKETIDALFGGGA
ncbi:MAG: hypothetical protein M0P69_08255 [Bacteroidales bacterium]|nr:hypothetical protein [Bacteroidales bacterium]